MKKSVILIWGIILAINLVYAQMEEFTEVRNIIKQNISCNKLTEDQLEAIGD